MASSNKLESAPALFGDGSRCVHIHNVEITNRTRDQKEIDSAVKGNWFQSVLFIGAKRGASDEVVHNYTTCECVHLPNGSLQRGSIIKKITGTRAWYRSVLELIGDRRIDVVHAHSLPTLPLAFMIKKRYGCGVLYDCHELETEVQILNSVTQPIYRWIERRLVGKCDAVVTVSASIADWYAKTYGIARPYLVRAIPDLSWQKLEPKVDLRSKFGIPQDQLLFLYKGSFNRASIDVLVNAWRTVAPDRHIVFMGFGIAAPTVQAAAEEMSNVHYQPGVAPEDVLRHTVSADAGFFFADPSTLSWRFALPNKVMEYLLSGLPIVTDEISVEPDRMVKELGVGWSVDRSPEGLATWVNRVSAQEIKEASGRVRTVAKGLSWKNESDVLLSAYRQAVAGSKYGAKR